MKGNVVHEQMRMSDIREVSGISTFCMIIGESCGKHYNVRSIEQSRIPKDYKYQEQNAYENQSQSNQ